MQQIVSSFLHVALSLFFLLLYLCLDIHIDYFFSRILFTHLNIVRSKYLSILELDETHTFMLWRQTCSI